MLTKIYEGNLSWNHEELLCDIKKKNKYQRNEQSRILSDFLEFSLHCGGKDGIIILSRMALWIWTIKNLNGEEYHRVNDIGIGIV